MRVVAGGLHEVVINYLLLKALALPDAPIAVAGVVHDDVANKLLLQALHVLLLE